MKKHCLATPIAILGTLLCATLTSAQKVGDQEVAALAVKHSDAMKANRAKLSKYSNNYRVEVSKEGELQWIDLVNVQVPKGKPPVLTQVNRDQVVPQEHGLLGRKERKQKEAAEEMDKVISYAMKWISYYNNLPADRVFTLFREAAKQGMAGASYSDEVLTVRASNVRDSDAGDTVTLTFYKRTGHPLRLAFDTPVAKGVDGDTPDRVTATINYRYLRDGSAFYPDHIELYIPSMNLSVKAEHLMSDKKP